VLLLVFRSQIFYYSAGVSTGMIASLVILFFILARFLPKVRVIIIIIIIIKGKSRLLLSLVCQVNNLPNDRFKLLVR